ncbi:MAG: IMPACT family protein [Rudaea sp.]
MTAARYVLAAPATLTREIRKSRFVVHAASVASPADALAFIAAVADADATHNCWAYRIGQQYRFSDAGEPAGTAGKPILQAIDAQHCDHTIAVVTRWFGGIKLGTGGLARAYCGCAAECLRLAAKTELIELATVEFTLPFSAVPILHARLAEFAATKLGERFDIGGVDLRLVLPAHRVTELRAMLADMTRGRSVLQVID